MRHSLGSDAHSSPAVFLPCFPSRPCPPSRRHPWSCRRVSYPPAFSRWSYPSSRSVRATSMPAAARILLPTMRGETQPSSRRRDTRFSGISPIFLLQGPPEDVARAPRDLARGFHSRVSQTTPYPWLTWSARLPSTRTFRPRRGLGKRQALRRRGESSSRLVAGWDLIGAGVRRRAAGRDAAADAELEASHRRCRSFRGRHRAATRGEADEHWGRFERRDVRDRDGEGDAKPRGRRCDRPWTNTSATRTTAWTSTRACPLTRNTRR